MSRTKNNKPQPLDIAYIGDSGTHYTHADYDRYCFLMSCSDMPALSKTAYFQALDRESQKHPNEYRLTVPSNEVLKKLANRYPENVVLKNLANRNTEIIK